MTTQSKLVDVHCLVEAGHGLQVIWSPTSRFEDDQRVLREGETKPSTLRIVHDLDSCALFKLINGKHKSDTNCKFMNVVENFKFE